MTEDRRHEVVRGMPKVSDLDVHKEVLSGEKRKTIRRSDFLKFTGGKRPLISSHLKSNVVATGLIVWCVFAFFLTYKVMKPETYEWVEQERHRIEAAKQKLELILKEEGSSNVLSQKKFKS